MGMINPHSRSGTSTGVAQFGTPARLALRR
jgi:hypothetical protein